MIIHPVRISQIFFVFAAMFTIMIVSLLSPSILRHKSHQYLEQTKDISRKKHLSTQQHISFPLHFTPVCLQHQMHISYIYCYLLASILVRDYMIHVKFKNIIVHNQNCYHSMILSLRRIEQTKHIACI